jgi:acetoin utilization deacetylase AcuC-like enzyme
MPDVGISLDPACLKHKPSIIEAEKPDRLLAIELALRSLKLWDRAFIIPARKARLDEIALAHRREYVQYIARCCALGQRPAAETAASAGTWEASLHAAGAGLAAVDAVMHGDIRRAFCAVRPPGHHAHAAQAGAFCVFNNVAIMAAYLRARHDVRKVAIVDIDVHHGDGTQDIFYADDTVLTMSVHEFGPDPIIPGRVFYPGTGREDERGTGKGTGFNVNAPLPPRCGIGEYRQAFEGRFLPALRRFRPNIILLAAGFDAHRMDPMAHMKLTSEDFGTLTAMLVRAAEEFCGGRMISTLEGGYELTALAESVTNHVRGLMGPGR